MFGESLLNDGITIVLYNTMVAFSHQPLETLETGQVLVAFMSFFTVVLGGLACGIVCGLLSALSLKLTQHARVMEPLVIVLMAYLSFVSAEIFHWSGILALIREVLKKTDDSKKKVEQCCKPLCCGEDIRQPAQFEPVNVS